MNKYPFLECVNCALKFIGACTVSADLLSCSNPEVNKVSNVPAYTFTYISGNCKTCAYYNGCKLRIQTTCEPMCCSNWTQIQPSPWSTKTNGTQLHKCPCCGQQFWD